VTSLKAKGLLSFPGARITTADFPRFLLAFAFCSPIIGCLGGPARRFLMLKVTVVSSGDVLILECRGRIVRGDETAI
jgi:hypothetical protein